MNSGSRRAIIAAFLANLGIAVAKFVGWAITGASSMLAEAIHSVADTSNQGLLLLGGALSRRREDAEHPFGYGRERYFWSFVVALVIFALGAAFALVEGVSKLRHPHPLESPGWALAILAVGLVFEGASLLTAIRESAPLRRGRSWWRFIHEAKVPELPVVLLEDSGALVGLTLAMLGIGLAQLTGDARFDALGSLAIGVLLGVIAVVLAMEMRSLLLGEAARREDARALRRVVEDHPLVHRLIHMRTEHIGPEQLLVAVKVEMDRSLDFEKLVAGINDLEQALRRAVPIARVIYVEPDIYRPRREPQE